MTTNILVRSEFLAEHPDVVQAVLDAHVQALEDIKNDPDQAKADVNAALQSLTGGSLDEKIIDSAWKQVQFTADPLPATLVTSAQHAVDVGLLDQGEVDAAGGLPGTLYDLTLINKSLTDAGLDPVQDSDRDSAGTGADRVAGTRRDQGLRSDEGRTAALHGVDLDVRRGEFVTVVGHSGCGKTTLLNIVAGLDTPSSGSVEVDGRTALMFQDATLLPWLTARQNVELALKLRGVPRSRTPIPGR